MFLKKIWLFFCEERPARTVWQPLMIQFCLEMGLFFSGVFSKDMQAQYWIVTFALVKLTKLYLNKPVTPKRISRYTILLHGYCFLGKRSHRYAKKGYGCHHSFHHLN